MLISKMLIYLSDKIPPKSILKKLGLSKIREQFFNFNFFGGHFVTKTSLLFEISIKFLIF
jgi:hypothetical protein